MTTLKMDNYFQRFLIVVLPRTCILSMSDNGRVCWGKIPINKKHI